MATRNEVMIDSGGSVLAAWAYASAPGQPCIVMAHGFSLTRHDGLEAYAERLADAGLSVLVFDHRYLGDSGGEPRQRFRAAEQLQDWRAAIAFARSLPAVDPAKIVLWGFSFAGGHVVTLAAEDRSLAAAIALCPFVNGLPRVVHARPRDVAWLLPRAIADLAGRTNLIPVTGPPGSHAAMTLPGEAEGFAAVIPPDSTWRDEITPGVFATVALHRPLSGARRIACPLWVGLGERDISVHGRSVERLAARAPKGELHRYPYDHFQPFLGDAPERVAADQLDFLRRNGLAS